MRKVKLVDGIGRYFEIEDDRMSGMVSMTIGNAVISDNVAIMTHSSPAYAGMRMVRRGSASRAASLDQTIAKRLV